MTGVVKISFFYKSIIYFYRDYFYITFYSVIVCFRTVFIISELLPSSLLSLASMSCISCRHYIDYLILRQGETEQ